LEKGGRDKSRFFEVLAHEAIMGTIAFDPSTKKCVYLNRLARENLEFEIAGDERATYELQICDLFPREEKRSFMARPLSEEMLKHEGLYQDVLMCKRNGMVFIANVGVKHVSLDDGTPMLIVMFQDITIQKKLQREIQVKQEEIHKAFTELLEQNRQLTELDQAKDRFVALTTHELRTPLSAIVATAEVLDLKLYDSEEQRDSFIKTIHEQGMHLMALVNDILDFAKIRAGKMEYFVENVDIVPIVTKLAQNFDHMAANANVKVEVNIPQTSVMAYADAVRLKEVISNVINNAIKYNKPGGKVMISIEELPGVVARVIIADTGQGIAESMLQHVFNEFETVGNVSRHHKGTGLGMPISKRLMEAIGGNLGLESKEGEGTTFFMDIPVAKVLDEKLYRSRADGWGDLAA
jgi:signal transduction histidine kinase